MTKEKIPFHEEYTAIKNILQATYTSIDAIDNAYMAPFKLRVQSDLKKHINFLATQLGETVTGKVNEFVTGNGEIRKSAPLRSMFGVKLNIQSAEEKPREVNVKNLQPIINQRTEADVELSELTRKVDRLYPEFLNIEENDIAASYNEIEIRAVGIRAGLPISETFPEKADIKLIRQIKEAIKVKQKEEEKEAGLVPQVQEQKKFEPVVTSENEKKSVAERLKGTKEIKDLVKDVTENK